MKIEKEDLVCFENGSKYMVVETLEINNKKYFYFSALEKNTVPQFMIMKEAKEKGEYVFSRLEEKEFEKIKVEFGRLIIKNN